MRRYLLYLAVAVLAFGIGSLISYRSYKTSRYSATAIQVEEIKSQPPAVSERPVIKAINNLGPDKSIDLETILTDKESLNYKGFTISRQYKKSKLQNGKPVDVPFAVIKKGNQRIYSFESNFDDKIRLVRFGLFPVLGDENNKQLIIECTANRYWHYAVIDLSPRFEVLFDNNEYPLMRDLEITDINKDGRYELIQNLSSFFYFGIGYRKGYATIPVIFTFDKKKQKYLFANRKFEDYLLKGSPGEPTIEDRIKRISEIKADKSDKSNAIGKEQDLFAAVMDIFLTYTYLGREKEAWTYFEEYDLPDKEEVRAEIKEYLKKDNLYNYSRRPAQ